AIGLDSAPNAARARTRVKEQALVPRRMLIVSTKLRFVRDAPEGGFSPRGASAPLADGEAKASRGLKPALQMFIPTPLIFRCCRRSNPDESRTDPGCSAADCRS